MAVDWTVRDADVGLRLDKFLAAPQRLGSRGKASAALEHGKVLLNGDDADLSAAARRLADGDVVRHWEDRPGSARPPRRPVEEDGLRILFEDEVLLVLDKPAGLLTVPLDRGRGDAPSVLAWLEERFRSHGRRRPVVVHRIDRDTSGLVVFAKDAATQAALQAQFRRREPDRLYLAVVHGSPEPATGTWRDRLVMHEAACLQQRAAADDPRGEDAISEYRVVDRFARTALIEVRLQTGKRNQIRVQAALRGHALIGDQRYGSPAARDADAFPRQALHAHQLSFQHPVDGRMQRFESPLPADLRGLVARLRRG